MLQQDALSILETGANVFLTGAPGSGKTYVVNAYVSWLRERGIEPAITASTGIAATHIRGMTIHSWSGIGVKQSLSAADIDAIASKEHVARRLVKSHVLIIDEVSMLSGETLSMVDAVLREVRRNPMPFGGMQVVLVGDFFQLPPVSKGGEASFAFESPAWRALNPLICYLEEQHRQEDEDFLALLSAMRAGSCGAEHTEQLASREREEIEEDVPRLYTHNADVDCMNDEKLSTLPGHARIFGMRDEGAPPLIEALKRGCLSPETLALKEGAAVIFTKNNPAGGYVNGTLGTVKEFERGTGYPVVETREGMELVVAPAEWAVEEGGKIRAKVTQVPLRLAWAITVHKSQGMSMDAAAIDLSRAFEYGQGYVALSRVRTLDGLYLLGWSAKALAVHPKVAEKDAEFKTASREARRAFAELEESGERAEMVKRFVTAAGGTMDAAPKGQKPAKKSTYDETLALVQEGKDVAGIAKARGLTFGTIADHLEKLVASGKLAAGDVEGMLPAALADALPRIHAVFDDVGAEKLAPAFGQLKGKHSYDHLKLARILYSES